MPPYPHPISVIIPAYNEELSIVDTVERIFHSLESSNFQFEILVVDDGSTDKTLYNAKTTEARLIKHDSNRGYGASLKSGILASSHNTIAIIDADGTYPCEALPEMVRILHQQKVSLVIGTRNSDKVHIPLIRKPAKWVISHLAQYIAGQPIADVNSGLRVFTKESVMPFFKILSDQFSFTTTQTLSMICNNYKICNVTIDYLPRKGKSKIVPWDFVNFISLILRLSMLFNPLKVFIPVAFTFFFLSGVKFFFDLFFAIQRIGWQDYSIFVHATLSISSLLLFLTGIQILLIGMMSDGLSRKIEQQIWGEAVKHYEEEPSDKSIQ
jgi:glycosyltransferase involved in cell wall biosynthesis